MEPTRPSDCWARGAAYEPFVGRWSRPVAREFVAWLAVPPGRRWLDAGCGTGALSRTVHERAAPLSVQAIDRSLDYLAYARADLPAGTGFAVADARTLPFVPDCFDVAVAGLVLNFVPEPATALAELCRVVRPGGLVAVYVWDYAGRMQLLRSFWDAAGALDPAALELDEGRRFAICQPEPLAALVADAGLGDVAVRPIDVPTVFRDFDDYWEPFLGGQGPAPSYVMSLSAARRDELRDSLRAALPIAPDGSIPLVARAWAARGRCV